MTPAYRPFFKTGWNWCALPRKKPGAKPGIFSPKTKYCCIDYSRLMSSRLTICIGFCGMQLLSFPVLVYFTSTGRLSY